MAHMFPDTAKTRVIFASSAEERFYETCRDSLSDKWRVYSSCTLSALEDGHGLRDNEIDFVLYHPRFGVVVVEVKGGRIHYDAGDGAFFSINRHDQTFEIKNPFKQVLIWKSRFLRHLRKNDIRVPCSHAVCFPTVAENEIPETAEIEPRLVIGVNRMQRLREAVEEIVIDSQPERYLSFEDVGDNVDRILRGATFSTRLHLRAYLDNHDLRLKDIEVITETLVTPIAGTPRLAVEGEAGTGKTMLAVMLARHFRDQGKRVLLLSSNPLMNAFLQRETGSGVKVATYTETAAGYHVDLLRKPKDYPGSADDWTQLEGPERLKQAITEATDQVDILVGDEAQDVQPFWWEAIEALLDPDRGRFYLFFDRSQGVFGAGGSDSGFVPEDVLPIAPPYFPLIHNYRTTREIAGFARAFRTGKAILQSHCGRIGYRPELIYYTDKDDFVRQMRRLFRRLFEVEGLRAKEVTVLSARRPFAKGSCLDGKETIGRYRLFDLGSRPGKKSLPSPRVIRDRVKVATITSFKGLETSIGIIINVSEYNLPLANPIMSSLLYVASTRAKHMLYVFLRRGDQKAKAVRKAAASIKQTGALVLEGSDADHEFVGRVVHYNPDRVGWLKVDDPAFEKSNIMFFPSDVKKAELGHIKVGKKIRFRPRVEGQTTIACELKAVEKGP